MASDQKKKDEKPKVDPETKSIVEEAVKSIHDKYVRKSVLLTLPNPGAKSDTDMTKRTETKIGGIPYWPKNKINEWPRYLGNDKDNGRIMYCLAQLNLDKLPHLENYPTTGLLQFFILDEDGWDETDTCKVVYWKNYKDEPAETVPDDVFKRVADDREDPPISEVYYPVAKLVDDYINPSSELIDIFDETTKIIAPKLGKSWTEYKNIDDKAVKDLVFNTVFDICKSSWGCRLGGYPSYTQSEPGYVDNDTINLLQLDSMAGMMWGNCGIAHFFIQKDDMKALKFDNKVYFTWDCC